MKEQVHSNIEITVTEDIITLSLCTEIMQAAVSQYVFTCQQLGKHFFVVCTLFYLTLVCSYRGDLDAHALFIRTRGSGSDGGSKDCGP